MKDYELTIIVRPDAGEEEIAKIREIIEEYAKITKEEDEGVKRLAYPIFDNDRGHYLYYNLEIEMGKVAELSCKLNITDEVMRYLLVQARPIY